MGAISHQLQLSLEGPQIENGSNATHTATDPGSEQADGLGTMVLTQLDQTRIRQQYHRLMLMSAAGEVARTFPLNRKQVHIGRSLRSGIRIKDRHASVNHLTVSLSDGVCVATDRDSTNGSFINGERLDGFRILRDGDEIMIGKTIFQYASREAQPRATQTEKPAPAGTIGQTAATRRTTPMQTFRRLVFALMMIFLSCALVFFVTDHLNQSEATQLSAAAPDASEPAIEGATADAPLPKGAVKEGAPRLLSEAQERKPLLGNALDQYAVGQINSAMQTLKAISLAVDNTPMALKARKTLMRLRLVKELYRQALQARDQKKFAQALEHWDGVLALDKELVGNRPSFFAVQAGLHVQTLSYHQALEAFQAKDHHQARQLCQMILKIDARNLEAKKLLARIEART